MISRPLAMTAIVRPPASNAVVCAMASIPCACRQSPTQNCLLPFLRYLQHTGQLEHCLFPSLSVPRHKYAVVLAFLPRFQPFSTQEEGWLLCGSASTSGPTRS